MPTPTGCVPRNYSGAYTSTSFWTYLEGANHSNCVCWKITPVAGSALGFTSHTKPLTLSGHPGVTFRPEGGLTPTTVDVSSGLAVPNLEVDAILRSDGITSAALRSGFWNYATFEIFVVNYKALTMGELILHAGQFGEIKLLGDTWRAEALGFNNAAQLNTGNLTAPKCRVANFANTICGLNRASFTTSRTVQGSPAPTARTFRLSGSDPGAGYHTNGEAKAMSGANAGILREIKSQAGLDFILKEAFPYALAAGDVVEVTAGCARDIATCGDKFNNAANFDGEPHTPGLEKTYKITRV